MVSNIKHKSKKLLISHVADVDGMGALILSKAHFGDIDYYLVEFSEVDNLIEKLIESGDYKLYDEIFVTDVSLRNKAIELIDANEELKSKIKQFDHHASEVGQSKKYSFINEIIKDSNGTLVCGTTLFYDYIKNDFEYKSEYLDKFLEAVRLYDTGGPLNSNQYGRDITALFGLLGIYAFVEKMTDGIKNKKDPVTSYDIAMVNEEYKRVEDYVNICDKNLVRIELDGHNVGVSISEQYRSSVGGELSKKYIDEIDYVLIINFIRNQFSFRTVKPGINVGQIAKSLHKAGGGNAGAAGMPIDSSTLYILDKVKQAMIEKEKQLKLTK